MYKIDFEKPIHIHFIGIGGISMSGLAEILLKEGFTVSGSDNKASALTEQLEKNGATVYIGQRAANIQPGIGLVVYTAAIHPDNAEWKAAHDAKIPMLTRAQFLGQLMDNYAKSIAVSGTQNLQRRKPSSFQCFPAHSFSDRLWITMRNPSLSQVHTARQQQLP